jgi:hypothetical protein
MAMFKRTCFLTTAALCLSGTSFFLRVAGAQKPNPELPAMAQFDNSPGYKITSDEATYGPFVNGVNQVEAVINTNSGDFLFNLWFSKKPMRHLSFDLGNGPSQMSCPVVSPTTPTSGVQTYMPFLNVQDVWSVPTDGDWHPRGALFQTFVSAGDFRFAAEYNPKPGDACTTMVQVRRAIESENGKPIWEIWAAPLENDLALQVQEINRLKQPAGYFRLPFKIRVKLL